ncbi:MAG: T9SS type A sorting domain-containing protein, partial [Bacteroidota bacterium]|nr:T9SS type A sorting domain-containing protein [Bacteroidota bacterium]
LDGKQHFSKVISLQATAPSATTVFPNPATDILNIKELMNYQSAQAIDLAGRVVQQYIIGYGETTLNITSLGKGIYALKLFGRNESRTVYFIKH